MSLRRPKSFECVEISFIFLGNVSLSLVRVAGEICVRAGVSDEIVADGIAIRPKLKTLNLLTKQKM